MWEITFQERSSKNNVIHKFNAMVITKVNRLMLQKILQSEQELHIWNSILVRLPVHQYQFYEYCVTRSCDMRIQRLATVPVFAKTIKVGGAYLPHHWSDWPKIVDVVLWVRKQHVYQVSLKSETVGFKLSVIFGDLTRNDQHVFLL